MKLELYHRLACPYSAKVRDFIAQEGLKSKIVYHDVDKQDSSLRNLQKLTGDDQVPCLVIDNRPLLESDEIVSWLETHEDELMQ